MQKHGPQPKNSGPLKIGSSSKFDTIRITTTRHNQFDYDYWRVHITDHNRSCDFSRIHKCKDTDKAWAIQKSLADYIAWRQEA